MNAFLTLGIFLVSAAGIGWSVKTARQVEREKADLVERIERLEGVVTENRGAADKSYESLRSYLSQTKGFHEQKAQELKKATIDQAITAQSIRVLTATVNGMEKRVSSLEDWDRDSIVVHRGSRRQLRADIEELFSRISAMEFQRKR